ncbi:MAG: RNA polymerase sigma factor [Patulibacter minatonensis]
MAPPLRRRASDRQLVEQLAVGDERAAHELSSRYRAALERYAASLLGGSAAEAEDVVQEAFVDALRVMKAGDRPRELRPWLYRIVRNRAIDEVRRARRRDLGLGGDERGAEPAAPAHDDPSAVAGRRESLRELVLDLAGLPDRQREALLVRIVDGDSPQRSAERLGVSIAAVQMLVVRGRENLALARAARGATTTSDLDRQLRALAPPSGLLATFGLVNALGLGGAKAVPAAVAAIAVVAAASGFAVVREQQVDAGEAAPFTLSGAGYVLGHRVVRGDRVPDGTAVVAATVALPAGPDGRDRRRVTLQCPAGMRFAEEVRQGRAPAVDYRGPAPWDQPRRDGRATFTFARTILTAPARVRVKIVCRRPGAGGSLLAHPRLPRPGEGRGTVCSKAPYVYRSPEHLFVGTVFRGQRVTLTARSSRSVYLITDDGVRGWIRTADLCPGWTSGGDARR